MRTFAVASAMSLLFCAGCASYTTPGGPVKLAEISRVDDEMASRQPSPKFPASIGVVRVQAPRYASASTGSYGKGAFSLVTAQELIGDPQLAAIGGWASVGKVQTLDPNLLPSKFDSLDDLRLAAAKLQIDVLLVTTVDTVFAAGGKTVEELLAAGCWDCHEWTNCPMACAFGVQSLDDIPLLFKPRVEQFIQLYDAKLLPRPDVAGAVA